MRYPLVDGRGNFGSVDGDPEADAVYTEARPAPLARELPRFPNLLAHLPGPDFPTGGVIVGGTSLRELYETGTGTLRLRARTREKAGRIIVTELPSGWSRREGSPGSATSRITPTAAGCGS